MEWISVEDRLPEVSGWYLACNISLNDYFPETMKWEDGWTDEYCGVAYVTHWMPLPEPPGDSD